MGRMSPRHTLHCRAIYVGETPAAGSDFLLGMTSYDTLYYFYYCHCCSSGVVPRRRCLDAWTLGEKRHVISAWVGWMPWICCCIDIKLDVEIATIGCSCFFQAGLHYPASCVMSSNIEKLRPPRELITVVQRCWTLLFLHVRSNRVMGFIAVRRAASRAQSLPCWPPAAFLSSLLYPWVMTSYLKVLPYSDRYSQYGCTIIWHI